MKYITKGKEPVYLTEYKKTIGATFQDMPSDCKAEIGDSLLEEQGCICAYCMRRISKDWNPKLNKPKVEIEHYASQYRHPDSVLNYKIMLGVCNGNADVSRHNLICDKAKSKFDKTHDLFINPLEANKIKQIYYTSKGEMMSDNQQIKFDINKILNLNERILKGERAKIFKSIKKEIKKIKKRFWNAPKSKKAALQKLQAEWERLYPSTNKEGKTILQFRPLCRVPLYLIEKELSKP